ncbi:MAG: four helix bundle protein [Anaerolineales bacterium]|nr:four helix bundle protein [Anaerolineales bacterium]
MSAKGLESLQVWQKARRFTVFVCREILPWFPREEKFALTQQLRRAVQSIPANISEAHGRYHFLDAVRFCYIARGSLDETLNHLIIAHDLHYISEDQLEDCREMWRDTYRLLHGYIEYLKRNVEVFKSYRMRDRDFMHDDYLLIPDP